MHTGHHRSPYLIDGQLPERVLGNVCCILDARDGFGIIQKQCVMFYERGKVPNKSEIVSAESKIVLVKSGIVSVESEMVPIESRSVSK
jgi:hypothetical protein